MADAGLASLEADYVEAQTRLVRALTALRLAQQLHTKLFGAQALQTDVERLTTALSPRPIDQA